MIKIHNRDPEFKHAVSKSLYFMLCTCLNPDSNRVEYNDKPMNTMDLQAYSNYSIHELTKAIKELYSKNILLNVKALGKDFYYFNPAFASDEETHPCLLEWLVELFGSETNQENKELVYFSKTHRNIKIDISNILPDTNK